MAFIAILLVSLLGTLLAVDPGIIFSVRETFLHEVTSEILPTLLANYNSVDVPNQSSDECSMTNIKVTFQPISSNTITISFVEAKNGMAADFSEINSSTSITFTCDFFQQRISGTLDFTGPLSATAQIDISSTKQGDESYVPQISSVSHFNVDADSSKFKIAFNCNPSCGEFAQEAISTVLTDVVLPGAIAAIETAVPPTLPSVANPMIISQFPVSFEIPNTPFSIQTGLTSTPTIAGSVFSLPIDGTVFLTADGYSRNGTLAQLPGSDSSLSQSVQLQISDYVVQGALINLSYDQQLNLTYTLGKFTFELYIDPSVNTGVKFASGGFQAFTEPHLSIYGESGNKIFGLKLGVSIYLGLSASTAASDGGLTDVTIRLKNLAVDNIHVEFGTFSMNLSLLKYPLNILLWITVKAVDEFGLKHVFEVPKQSAMGFTLESLDTHFHNGYVTAGVEVSYSATS